MSDSTLRRDLGSLSGYATIVGILVGAGIFRVTGEAGDSYTVGSTDNQWVLNKPHRTVGLCVVCENQTMSRLAGQLTHRF